MISWAPCPSGFLSCRSRESTDGKSCDCFKKYYGQKAVLIFSYAAEDVAACYTLPASFCSRTTRRFGSRVRCRSTSQTGENRWCCGGHPEVPGQRLSALHGLALCHLLCVLQPLAGLRWGGVPSHGHGVCGQEGCCSLRALAT